MSKVYQLYFIWLTTYAKTMLRRDCTSAQPDLHMLFVRMLYVHAINEVFSRDGIHVGMPLTEIIPYHIKEQ